MSNEYARAAHRMDQALGLLAAMAGVEEDEGTLLIALADHGGGLDPRLSFTLSLSDSGLACPANE